MFYLYYVFFRYGWAQSQTIPTHDFRFEDVTDKIVQEILETNKKACRGYILKVDLEYPESLHEHHRNFPLAPEFLDISPDMLSDYQKKCHKKLNTRAKTTTKLVASFKGRENYVIHYENLKTYLRLGMKLKKVHKVISFEQSTFLKTFIDYCTEKRKKASSDFDKTFYKLVLNSCYGKTIQDPTKYLRVSFVTDKTKMKQLMTDPTFHSYKIMSKHFVIVYRNHNSVKIRQPIGIGFTILEGSKRFMYESFYDKIMPAFKNDVRVLFSDTDSFFFSVPHSEKNPLKKMAKILDTSNFDKNHPMYDPSRKSQLGYFKSEVGNNEIDQFIGLRSKVYAFKTMNTIQKKCKGISKRYRKNIPFSAFENCLNSIQSFATHQYKLSSKSHIIRLVKNTRLCFSSYDDKNYLLKCGIHSLPYFSREIEKNIDKCSFCK